MTFYNVHLIISVFIFYEKLYFFLSWKRLLENAYNDNATTYKLFFSKELTNQNNNLRKLKKTIFGEGWKKPLESSFSAETQ